MEIALGICSILMFNLFYYAALKGIDYGEKGSNKKTYSIGLWKYVMIRYTWKIEATREEEEEAKRKTKREKDPINASTISCLSFWLHILNFIFVVTIIVLSVIDIVSPTDSVNRIVMLLRKLFVALLPVTVIFAIIKSEKMLSKRKFRIKPSQDDLNILLEYFNIRIPQLLYDTESDEYDFIADNTFLSEIVHEAIEGRGISKFKSVSEFMDSEYQEAKKSMLDNNANTADYQKLSQYFELYEKTITVLEKIIKQSLL